MNLSLTKRVSKHFLSSLTITMTSELSLKKLLKRSISQHVSSKTFNSLYHQLNCIQPVPDNEYFTELLELKSKSDHQVVLVIGLALDSGAELEKFWKFLGRLSSEDQLVYINKFSSSMSSANGDVLKGLMGPSFQEYVLTYLNTGGDSSLIYKIVFLIGNFVQQPHTNYSIAPQDFSIKLLKALKRLKFNKLLEFLFSRVKSYLSSNDIALLSSSKITGVGQNISEIKIEEHLEDETIPNSSSAGTASFKTLSVKNLSKEKLEQYLNMKKYFWFKKMMKDWQFSGNEEFLNSFTANFVGDKKSNSSAVLSDLVQSIFTGMAYAIMDNEKPYILINWKTFVLSRLPVILSGYLPADVEKSIISALGALAPRVTKILSSVTIGGAKPFDATQTFVKSCVFNKALTVQSYSTIFPLLPPLNNELQQLNSDRNWNLVAKFNEKLLHVNVEFTSLEESGLIDFVNSLPPLLEYSFKKQVELSELFSKMLDDLMGSKDFEKLNRLLLAFLNNVQLLNIIIFNTPAYKVLGKLINFIDNESFSIDVNDENFQEFYSYFGVLILGVTLISETFGINLSQYKIKGSFILEYLNGFYYRLVDNLTNQMPGGSNEEDLTVVMNYNGLFNDWVNALFDDKNDGLSDELIKSVNIKQIYKLVPIIYQQSIVATKIGTINFEILVNGIDYLSQVFLIPCTISIINWLLNRFQANNEMLYVSVLYEIIKSNFNEIEELTDDSGGPKTVVSSLIFRIVLQISGNKILTTLKRVKDWQSSKQIANIVKIVEQNVDINYIEKTSHLLPDSRNDVELQFKEYLVKGPNDSVDNLRVVDLFCKGDPLKLVGLLLDEVQQKNNNEDAVLIINLGVLLMILSVVSTKDDKEHWYSVFNSDPKSEDGGDQTGISYGEKFELSEDNHFSSIFNVDDDVEMNSGNGGVKLEVLDNGEMNDVDDMIIDDDDLFDDPMGDGISNTFLPHTSKPSTSETLGKLVEYLNANGSNALAKFKKERAKENPPSKSVKALSDFILKELKGLYV